MMVKTSADLPCIDCFDTCEARLWLTRAYELEKGGFPVTTINLPCPKNNVTYIIKEES